MEPPQELFLKIRPSPFEKNLDLPLHAKMKVDFFPDMFRDVRPRLLPVFLNQTFLDSQKIEQRISNCSRKQQQVEILVMSDHVGPVYRRQCDVTAIQRRLFRRVCKIFEFYHFVVCLHRHVRAMLLYHSGVSGHDLFTHQQSQKFAATENENGRHCKSNSWKFLEKKIN